MAEKKETREMLQSKADNLFRSNKELKEVHLCANAQGFTDKQYAERYAKQFADDNVYTFVHEKRAKAKAEADKKAKEEAARKQKEVEQKAKEEKEKQESESKKKEAAKKKAEQKEAAKKQEPFDYEKVNKELLEDRDFLFARHEALTGKKPASNIGTEKLAVKVQEIEKELFANEKTE